MPDDEFNHFRQAQDPVFEQVTKELSHGQKLSHWLWFIFPQLQGLRRSEITQKFAIESQGHAKRYAADPVLGHGSNNRRIEANE